MDGAASDRFHALEEKDGRERTAPDLVRQISFGFMHADRG
jgi:hypothetical protein